MNEAEVGPRFRETALTFDGVTGETVDIPSANPVNYHQVITDPGHGPQITVDGKLFARPDGRPQPLVIVVPGSLGVGPNHTAHAERLFAEGYATFLLDPFGARSVASTVANQAQYSFAASAFDVLAAFRTLRQHPLVDGDRISAQGHSRGGSAVTIAAMRRFADAVIGPELALAGVYAVYPWCGHQFGDPTVGPTRYRAIVGDRDDWLSVQQVQAQVAAIRLAGGDASVRVVAGAAHSFDRLQPPTAITEASVAPTAPTATIADDGALVDPYTGRADPATTDRDLFLASIEGHGRRGAHIGSEGDQPELFTADMLEFHASVLGP